MNEDMIRRWNEAVQPDDTVYHLGDVAFASPEKAVPLLQRLHGTKILVHGNHDGRKHLTAYREAKIFEEEHDLLIRHFELPNGPNGAPTKQGIVMCHFPIEVWAEAHKGNWHLHGHSHGSLTSTDLRLDVGWDVFMRPISLASVAQIMAGRAFKVRDHHGTRET